MAWAEWQADPVNKHGAVSQQGSPGHQDYLRMNYSRWESPMAAKSPETKARARLNVSKPNDPTWESKPPTGFEIRWSFSLSPLHGAILGRTQNREMPRRRQLMVTQIHSPKHCPATPWATWVWYCHPSLGTVVVHIQALFGYPDDECANKAREIATYLPFYVISFSGLYSALPQRNHLWVCGRWFE